MKTHVDKTQKNKSRAVANTVSRKQSSGGTFQLVDNRPETVQLQKLQEIIANSPHAKKIAQFQAMMDNSKNPHHVQLQKMQEMIANSQLGKTAVLPGVLQKKGPLDEDELQFKSKEAVQKKGPLDEEELQFKAKDTAQLAGPLDEEELQFKSKEAVQKKGPLDEDELQFKKDETVQCKGPLDEEELQFKAEEPVQKQENKTGLPDGLKAGVENLSGMAMDDVRVHYNSGKPAQLNAYAYTQGTEIHVAPGQEKHLPHEAWHVVQQKQGRVQPTVQMKGGINVNDDAGLEKEASVMGNKTLCPNISSSHTLKQDSLTTPTVQGVFALSNYRLSDGVTRNIYVEKGGFVTTNPPLANLDRAVLHETMVRSGNAAGLAQRFNQATVNFNNAVGLSVSINASYRQENQVQGAQQQLTQTATQIENTATSPINVVRVLWQDGRANPNNDAIRAEVPFAELRRHAASDAGSQALYNQLQTQANTVWRKMGDDDMPFVNPNNNNEEVNQELGRLEKNNKDCGRGNLVSFSYDLIPNSNDRAIQQICHDVYRAEAVTIADVRNEFSISVYAIEPTTYYRGQGGGDAGTEWNNYEAHSDSHNKQIKEGASFGKALNQKYQMPAEYIELNMPLPTEDGGRLANLVELLVQELNPKHTVNVDQIFIELDAALKAIDQSIWDGETLTRGAKWMCRTQQEKDGIDALTPDINKVINKNYATLLVNLVSKIIKENNLRRRLASSQDVIRD